MAQHGGKRKGAGRKKGHKASHTIQTEKAREYVIQRITEELEPIMTAQIEAAKGLYFIGKEGQVVYQEKPDITAGKNLLDQTIGKAKETVELKEDVTLKIDV